MVPALLLLGSTIAFDLGTVRTRLSQAMSPHASNSIQCSTVTAASDLGQAISSTPCIVYSQATCPYCVQAKEALDEIGAVYTVVDIEQDASLRTELATFAGGRTSVPAIFVGGEFVGGANDGGLGGVLTLQREGRLAPLLAEAGALDVSAGLSDPVAQVFSKVLFKGDSGKSIAWGVLQKDVDPAQVPSDEERAARRASAARDLTNIDDAERERRKLAGTAFAGVTAALALGLLVTHAAPLARAAIAPPLFLSYGFLASARQGL